MRSIPLAPYSAQSSTMRRAPTLHAASCALRSPMKVSDSRMLSRRISCSVSLTSPASMYLSGGMRRPSW